MSGRPDSPKQVPEQLARLNEVAVAAAVLLVPFNSWLMINLGTHSPHLSGGLAQSTFVGALDVVILLLIGLAATAAVLCGRQAFNLASTGLLVLAAAAIVGLIFHPSLEGGFLVYRMVGGAAVAVILHTLDQRGFIRALVLPLTAGALFQAVSAIAQTFVLDAGRTRSGLEAIGWTAGLGSFRHEYALAAYLVIALAVFVASGALRAQPVPRWIAAAVLSGAVATSFGRTAAISLALFVLCFAVAWLLDHRREHLCAWLVPAASFGVAALASRHAWATRANTDAPVRSELTRLALDAIQANPFGIGPAQFGRFMASVQDPELRIFVVHNVPLLVAAELGIAVGIAALVWLVAMGYRAWRAGIAAIAVFVVAVPFFVFDNLLYIYPSSFVMVGVWAGAAAWFSTQRSTDQTA